MDPQSPPKRMTRARAAAKGTEPAAKTTRIQLPVSAMKATKPTRGRPKKAVAEPASAPEPQASEPVKSVRGRPRKAAEPVAEEPARGGIRMTRTKKTKAEDESETPAEPVKKATRGRPAASTVASRPPVAKNALKKSVKFEEPEKENIAPSAAAPRKAATKAAAPVSGLRAKPMRRPATAGRAVRGTRPTAAAAAAVSSSQGKDDQQKPLPLSPKKVNQMAANKVDSDDELAMDNKTPVRSLKRNPIKPAVGAKKVVESAPHTDSDEDMVLNLPETVVSAVNLGSPARRPAPSPWKNSMNSPARRVEGVLGLSAPQMTNDGQPAQSSFKASLLQSPAKRVPVLKGLELGSVGGPQPGSSSLKISLLSSPAKRIMSPAKSFAPPTQEDEFLGRSPAPKATLLATPRPAEISGNACEDDDEEMDFDHHDDDALPDSPTRLRFPGRLSAVLPRHADPEMKSTILALPETTEDDEEEQDSLSTVAAEDNEAAEELGDMMVLDEPLCADDTVNSTSTTPPHSPPKVSNAMFALRDRDLEPYDEAESEDDDQTVTRKGRLPRGLGPAPATPCPATSATPGSRAANSRTRSSGRSTAKRVRVNGKFGFTPLAQQLDSWSAGGSSPLKTGISAESPTAAAFTTSGDHASLASSDVATSLAPELSPMQNTFFEDEMLVRPDTVQQENEAEPEGEIVIMDTDIESPVLDDIPFTEEDVALAAEADEMSLMEPEVVEELVHNQVLDDSLSETSQEYGDENEVPVELLNTADRAQGLNIPPVTPQRVIYREVQTVSKVPLKPAAEDSPRKMKKRSHSISRLPIQRPTHTLTRSASVISYSPMKSDERRSPENEQQEDEAESENAPVTPAKSEACWSMMGTPARTPRRDIDPALLRGAVVFVDVHTTEGDDASALFVELLGWMGARCVKSWSWNPDSPAEDDSSSSKVGITHVVYKDGGKRTLEKVRQSGGVVQCVGVSWVLDCERENQWLDEAPYYIDTASVPRGGARRRKSMEPKAIANLNGMLVPTPVRNTNNGASSPRSSNQATPKTPTNRRDSGLWMHTPEDDITRLNSLDDDGDADAIHEDAELTTVLTPVPKTPAPEAVARYAANLSPATPSMMESDDEDAADMPVDPMMRTCPPKPTGGKLFPELGAGVLGKEKDEKVLMRLMAARRKSLQFAPKVGSPLARAWKH
ncbi:hypothetical protein B0T17DRAFT_537809 [Bombardia bombarda]|uniref:BRCT domain-containing protein n=1 Tax=Bombardia bombarda TaxID=252184 RepID=A0AA40BYC5_9PEZI|nr:hypothetical protein B0T17DRAFT_537809 [Bombardia bombarda]